MPKQSNTSIPLLCNLCPKNPRFSDVSHLLTHISSKSHLSNRFKLQIRSQGEVEPRQLLAEFDDWYKKNGLEDLLSERLASKEQKKTTKRVRTPSAATKVERDTKDELDQPLAVTPIYRPPVPRMHTWSTEPYAPDFTPLPPASPWNHNHTYGTPTMKRNLPNFSLNKSAGFHSTSPIPSTPSKNDDTEDENEKEDESSKLKGVFWPGMSLFDSATAEMKRMRNQKKDGTALAQMMMSSAQVEPTEWIFNPDGGLHRTRDIFDESPESSPAKSEWAPSPKKRRSRKTALAEISVNVPRLRGPVMRQPTKKTTVKRKAATLKSNQAALAKSLRPTHLTVLAGSRFVPSPEEDQEFRLTINDPGKPRRLGIFRDAEERSPGRTESPLEDHRFDFSNGRNVQSKKVNSVMQTSPAPVFMPMTRHIIGKENMEQGQMKQRLMSGAPTGFHPQTFLNDSINPLLYHSHAHSFAYGDRRDYNINSRHTNHAFMDDFKPIMMANSFHGMAGPHKYAEKPDHGRIDSMGFRI